MTNFFMLFTLISVIGLIPIIANWPRLLIKGQYSPQLLARYDGNLYLIAYIQPDEPGPVWKSSAAIQQVECILYTIDRINRDEDNIIYRKHNITLGAIIFGISNDAHDKQIDLTDLVGELYQTSSDYCIIGILDGTKNFLQLAELLVSNHIMIPQISFGGMQTIPRRANDSTFYKHLARTIPSEASLIPVMIMLIEAILAQSQQENYLKIVYAESSTETIVLLEEALKDIIQYVGVVSKTKIKNFGETNFNHIIENLEPGNTLVIILVISLTQESIVALMSSLSPHNHKLYWIFSSNKAELYVNKNESNPYLSSQMIQIVHHSEQVSGFSGYFNQLYHSNGTENHLIPLFRSTDYLRGLSRVILSNNELELLDSQSSYHGMIAHMDYSTKQRATIKHSGNLQFVSDAVNIFGEALSHMLSSDKKDEYLTPLCTFDTNALLGQIYNVTLSGRGKGRKATNFRFDSNHEAEPTKLDIYQSSVKKENKIKRNWLKSASFEYLATNSYRLKVDKLISGEKSTLLIETSRTNCMRECASGFTMKSEVEVIGVEEKNIKCFYCKLCKKSDAVIDNKTQCQACDVWRKSKDRKDHFQCSKNLNLEVTVPSRPQTKIQFTLILTLLVCVVMIIVYLIYYKYYQQEIFKASGRDTHKMVVYSMLIGLATSLAILICPRNSPLEMDLYCYMVFFGHSTADCIFPIANTLHLYRVWRIFTIAKDKNIRETLKITCVSPRSQYLQCCTVWLLWQMTMMAILASMKSVFSLPRKVSYSYPTVRLYWVLCNFEQEIQYSLLTAALPALLLLASLALTIDLKRNHVPEIYNGLVTNSIVVATLFILWIIHYLCHEKLIKAESRTLMSRSYVLAIFIIIKVNIPLIFIYIPKIFRLQRYNSKIDTRNSIAFQYKTAISTV